MLNDVIFHTNISSVFQITFDAHVGALGKLCILRYTSIYKIDLVLKIAFKIFKIESNCSSD